jgi:cellulose synthase/poly-beta-1,6-N-acetylglucosamine synthase-like glycosyltransferase
VSRLWRAKHLPGLQPLRASFGLTPRTSSLPFIPVTEWRPCPPLNAKLPGALPTVDVVIPTYQETLRDIVDTIVSTQRVEYAEDKMVAYILDDAARDDVKRICGELSGSGLLRYKLVYVRRPRNRGKKGGNLNNWLRKYEAQSGEFFVVLDADMQPFPDMLDILIGHYYGLPVETQERIAYIQTPQWYRNNLQSNKWHDAFVIGPPHTAHLARGKVTRH